MNAVSMVKVFSMSSISLYGLTGLELSHESVDKIRPYALLQQLQTHPHISNSAFQSVAA